MIVTQHDWVNIEQLMYDLVNTTKPLEDVLVERGSSMPPNRVRGRLRIAGLDRCQRCGRWRQSSMLSADLCCYPTCNTKEDSTSCDS